MNRLFANAALLLLLFLSGCGTKELGPAKPSNVPENTKAVEDAKKQSMEHMPEGAKKMYGGGK